MVENLRNHPSVLGWVTFNAGWGQYDTARVSEMVKQVDPTRLVTCVSGWNLLNRQGFVVDVYSYPGPGGKGIKGDKGWIRGQVDKRPGAFS